MSTDLDIGRLTPADEALNHQIADTFATVAESERGWTEKIWASIARKDGGLQIDFGLGKYLNRNVMDGFAGVSRGREQWTVRASRVLEPALDETAVGSIRYEVIEPLKQVRFVLEPSPTQPIAFDIVFHAEMPAFFEKRNRMRTGNRIRNDVVRYHQGGHVTGWLEVAGERHTLGDDWFAFRDHSWGTRGDNVGFLPPDVQPRSSASRMRLLWGAYELSRPDGSRYGISAYFSSNEHWDYFSGQVNEADGTQHIILRIVPEVRLDPTTRHFLGGHYSMLMASGETRHLVLEGLGETGFYLRTGLYGEWAGARWGSWRGGDHQEGEYIADCTSRLHDLGHLRDKPVRLREGDAQGWGIQESIYAGLFPELGLGAESNFPLQL
ncbi:MAG: hypothetical protein ABI574_00640 [Burkholderiales bacterium]